LVAAIEHCSIREAALNLRNWYKVGETQVSDSAPRDQEDTGAEVRRGTYRDARGSLFEVIAAAASAEDFELLVIYRELLGDYRF